MRAIRYETNGGGGKKDFAHTRALSIIITSVHRSQ